ncbi:hypothetical protein CLAIMM_13085 [Cladophialophora immunda]|nr:hypothetical protein CLAIMM_13085 [Cladophialophora immunda]
MRKEGDGHFKVLFCDQVLSKSAVARVLKQIRLGYLGLTDFTYRTCCYLLHYKSGTLIMLKVARHHE